MAASGMPISPYQRSRGRNPGAANSQNSKATYGNAIARPAQQGDLHEHADRLGHFDGLER